MHFIVEITPHEGETASVIVDSPGISRDGEPCMYAVMSQEDDGVLRVIDAGYTSLAEVRDAWPELAQTR